MSVHVKKNQENKSQLVAHDSSPKRNGKASDLHFENNRPEAIAQRKLQETANNNPQIIQQMGYQKLANSSPRAKQVVDIAGIADIHNKTKQGSGWTHEGRPVVQRYAYVGEKQVIEAYQGMEQYSNVMQDTEQVKNPNPKQSDVINDRYYRRYQNRQEFDRHTTGQPVDVGLIDHLAKWYRLPFSKGFFVLGESHNIANYRRLIEESNQTGDILGEGGNVPILHYSQPRQQRIGSVPTMQVGKATEHAMESIVAKTAYALASLRDDLHRQLWPTIEQKPGPKMKFQNSADWLEYVDLNKPKVKRDPKRRPYYILDDVRMVLVPNREAQEGNYQRGNTAVRLLTRCVDRFQEYQKGLETADLGVLDFQRMLSNLVADYQKFQYLTPEEKQRLYWVDLKEATEEARLLAQIEIEESTISRDQKSGKALISEQAKENTTKGLLGETCTLRDVFMYEAIIDAQSRNFVMAGIGDDHLQHLRGPLNKVKIKTISYKDFFDHHTSDAIHP